MEEGMITGDGRHWLKDKSITGSLTKIANPGFGSPTISAYMCQNCGKVELQAEK